MMIYAFVGKSLMRFAISVAESFEPIETVGYEMCEPLSSAISRTDQEIEDPFANAAVTVNVS